LLVSAETQNVDSIGSPMNKHANKNEMPQKRRKAQNGLSLTFLIPAP
jgi:hypothetical protein